MEIQEIKISQSLINDAMDVDACGQFIKFKYVDKKKIEPTDLMLYGSYFEHHLIGSTRDKNVPEIPKLKKGGDSQAQKDLDALIVYARDICSKIGLDLTVEAEAQVELQFDDTIGHLDLISNDIQRPHRRAIIDIKYTETKYDDRWNGWADFETKYDAKTQATQYIMLYKLTRGDYVPYYFLIFGKSKWCRIIKVEITEQSLVYHEMKLSATREKVKTWQKNNWSASPEFMKCTNCPFNNICEHVAKKPTIEIFQI